MKRFALPVVGLVGLLVLAIAALSPALASGPSFAKGNFHHPTDITNKYFPLEPGTTFVYKGTKDGVAQNLGLRGAELSGHFGRAIGEPRMTRSFTAPRRG